VQQIAAWRKSLPAPRRYPAHRALSQVLAAAARWKWIEENAAAGVKNPQPPMGEIDPFEDWAEIDAIGAELDVVLGGLVRFPWARAFGWRRRSAPSGVTSTWRSRRSRCGVRSRMAAEAVSEDGAAAGSSTRAW